MRTGRRPGYSATRANILVGVFGLLLVAVSIPAYSGTMTFAADCVTPQTTFNLGETVCAKAAGLSGFRFQWVDPDGFAVATTDILSDPQTNSLGLPPTSQSSIGGLFTANNLGRWRVNAITSRNSVNTAAFFTVKDPANPKADLSIFKSMIGSVDPTAGAPFRFVVTIVNNGPNDAVNTHFVDNVFTNSSFVSLSQIAGPSFTCSGADCLIASFPNGAVASFLLNFTAGAADGVIENTATVSSGTPELNTADNSSTSAPVKIAPGGVQPTCDLAITAPPAVTLSTGPAATSCDVLVNDLDATLGTASVTATCQLVGGVTRTGVPPGNLFPVGTTTVTYSATDTVDNTALATQLVTVVDNTPPLITCPANIILEPTCTSGAVGTWGLPVASDNCPNPTVAQSSGPVPGSVFPIGTTAVSYTVSDSSGNQASCSFSITVLTATVALQNVEASVNASSLTGPQKQGLVPKIEAALAAYNRGEPKAACNVLGAFIKSVQGYITHGDVSQAQGQAWINSATNIGNAIGCTSNPCS